MLLNDVYKKQIATEMAIAKGGLGGCKTRNRSLLVG